MAMRRSRRDLENAILNAATPPEAASAHFELALFHDNNNREAEAIPHYEEALRLVLPSEQRAKCLAWLASSLYKTEKFQEALARADESATLADSELTKWLSGLRRRIKRPRPI